MNPNHHDIPTADPDDAIPRIGRSLWGDALHRLLRDRVGVISFVIIAVYAATALVAPILLPKWSDKVDYAAANAAPSAEHWFGTDIFGRDVLKKTLLGASTSMSVGLFSNIVAIPLGMLLGAIAGYYGGWIDDLIVWLYTTLSCIPGIILLFALKFAFAGQVYFQNRWYEVDMNGVTGMCFALAVLNWIGTCRLVRAETLKLRETDYVLAGRACGTSSFKILLKHILPNVSHLAIINFSLGFIGAVKAEVILSYLGLGVMDRPSWGRMINSAKIDLIVGRWWEITAAVGAMFLIVLAWNLFGDRLRDALDPRLKNVS